MAIQEHHGRTLENLDALIQEVVKDTGVPGLALAVIKDGETLLERGWGLRNVAEQLEVTPQTLFAIGSSTKAFTALALAILVDEGKLAWDTPVRHYLPTFQLHDPVATERLTPRDLLIHNSGLPRYDLAWYSSTISRKELVERLRYFESTHDFRTRWQYQNMMYMAAGYLIEVVSGLTWEEFVRQRIMIPLEMTNSNFSVNDSQQSSDFALAYREVKGELQHINFYDRFQAVGPAGSINSNLQDMIKWLRCLLRKGCYGDDEQRIVSEAQFAQLVTPQIITPDLPTFYTRYEELFSWTYAMGWFVSSYRGHVMIQHGGNIDGFSALVAFLPDDDIGMVVLTNLDGNIATETIALHVCDYLLELSEIPWHARFQQKWATLKEQVEKMKEEQRADRVPDASPSHPLDDYTGRFEHPGYGTFTITRQDGQLQGLYNDLKFTFEHLHYDVFFVVQKDFDVSVKGAFAMDLNGKIEHFSIALEPQTKPIVFTRHEEKPS